MRFVRVGAWSVAACALSCGSAASAPAPAPTSQPVAPSASSAGALDPAPVDPTATKKARQTELIARTLREVEHARGIASKGPVPGVLLDRDALIARVKAHVTRELPTEALHDEGVELTLMGFIPTSFDYEGAEYALLQDQLAGYYEPEDKTMYMATDLPTDEAVATLAHELVHALQDQRWDLGERSRYRAGDGDRSEAVSALAEGDATSAMFDVMVARDGLGKDKSAVDIPDDVFVEQIRAGMNTGPAATAPSLMRTSLVAPYIYGTLFVHALRRQGGWPAVDQAWDNPPTTTEQILHLDKFLAREAPLAIAAPTFAALGTGWRVADEDSEGELGLRLVLEEWLGAQPAGLRSAGWGGDRGVLLRNEDRAAFGWRVRYDAVRGAERASATFEAVSAALERTLGRSAVREPSFSCHERKDRGPLSIARGGADLVFTVGPAVTRPSAWASAGDCALARRWSREILASGRP